jgi:MiaB/RimO family radical SAM methylthiotransferase
VRRNNSGAGVKELVLISQDSTRYGEDLGIKDGLADLLRSLAKVDGIEWIRVMYSYPNSLSDETLKVMGEEEKVCSYLDMPLQHASASVLRRMRRGGDRRLLEKLLNRARSFVPGITLRTTVIVGFPGETDEDFEELMGFVRDVEFDRVGVFTYSDEEGTHGFDLHEKVPARVMKSRRAKLMREQAKISRRRNNELIGKRFRALFEEQTLRANCFFRRDSNRRLLKLMVNCSSTMPDDFARGGRFVQVEITAAHEQISWRGLFEDGWRERLASRQAGDHHRDWLRRGIRAGCARYLRFNCRTGPGIRPDLLSKVSAKCALCDIDRGQCCSRARRNLGRDTSGADLWKEGSRRDCHR